MTTLCDQRLLADEELVADRMTARKNRSRCGPVAPWHILSKALGELIKVIS